MSPDLLAIFDKINQIPWRDFEYGSRDPAVAKKMMRELIVGDEDERLDAINDLIWDWACHQGMLCSKTPWVLDVVIDLLTFKDWMDEPVNVYIGLLQEALCFVRICVDKGYLLEWDDKVRILWSLKSWPLRGEMFMNSMRTTKIRVWCSMFCGCGTIVVDRWRRRRTLCLDGRSKGMVAVLCLLTWLGTRF